MFVGYGGASWALRKANIPFESIGISEIDKYAIQCYYNNFPRVKNYGDCSKINPNDLPDFNLLTGGFPCQDVSIAGNKDLSKGRTNLYLEILRIAKVKKPKYMILENVKGLEMIEIEGRKLSNIITSDLQKLGYGVCRKILNSKNCGVPQNRERIWFVCKLGGWDFAEFHFPEKETLKINLRSLLEKKVDKKYYLTKHQRNFIDKKSKQGRGKELQERIKEIPEISMCLKTGSQKKYVVEATIINENLLEGKKNFKGNRIISTKGIMSSLVCNINNNDLINDEEKIRVLTPKECFRLMGFLNDEINLEGLSDTQKYRLAGNGWDIILVSKIFRRLKKQSDFI